MSFNPDPNKQAIELHFSRKMNSPNHPSLDYNNQEVCRATDHKQIGLILDTKLTFTKHVAQKISIVRIGIGDYGDIIYHLPSLTNPSDSSINLNFMMQSLESTQYQAAPGRSRCIEELKQN